MKIVRRIEDRKGGREKSRDEEESRKRVRGGVSEAGERREQWKRWLLKTVLFRVQLLVYWTKATVIA